MLVRHSEDKELTLGDEVALMMPAQYAHLFDYKGAAFQRMASALQKQFVTV